MNVHHLVVGMLKVNCFLLHDPESNEAFLIDPGDDADKILRLIEQTGANVTRITNTHAHFDHVLAVPDVQAATGATFHLHEDEMPVLGWAGDAAAAWLGIDWGPAPAVDSYLSQGDVLRLGETSLEIRHVPGHSPGSIIYIDHAGRRAWVGDTVFAGAIGRTDFPGCDFPALIEGIHTQILSLPNDYELYPGHGPFTTVGRERRSNPFCTERVRANAVRGFGL
ncbi:MAG: MBL fold metallo-hydrolase [Caldilineales bacterium]|nr:MBL fold metallo-hydrolase [Caldilineales bacterium]